MALTPMRGPSLTRIAEHLEGMAADCLPDAASQDAAAELREIADALRTARWGFRVEAPLAAVVGLAFAAGWILGALLMRAH